jgi:hypothetical protein
MPQTRQLVAILSLRKPGFDPNPDHVRYVKEEMAMQQVFSGYLGLPLSVPFK